MVRGVNNSDATRATRSLCSATNLVNAGYSIEMRPTLSVLPHNGGDCTLFSTLRKALLLVNPSANSCEINAITFSTMKRDPMVTVIDKRCEIYVKSSGNSRHPRRVFSESCAFDHATVTLKESDGYDTVLTDKGPRCECFSRVVSRKGHSLRDLEHYFAIMRASFFFLQVRYDDEEDRRHVLKDACERVHFECTRLESCNHERKGWYSVRNLQFSLWVSSFPSNLVRQCVDVA